MAFTTTRTCSDFQILTSEISGHSFRASLKVNGVEHRCVVNRRHGQRLYVTLERPNPSRRGWTSWASVPELQLSDVRLWVQTQVYGLVDSGTYPLLDTFAAPYVDHRGHAHGRLNGQKDDSIGRDETVHAAKQAEEAERRKKTDERVAAVHRANALSRNQCALFDAASLALGCLHTGNVEAAKLALTNILEKIAKEGSTPENPFDLNA